MFDESSNLTEEHTRWMVAAEKRKRHAEAAQRSRQRRRAGTPMRSRRTAAELADLAAKPPDTRTSQEIEALRCHKKEVRRKRRRESLLLASSTAAAAASVPAVAGVPAMAAAPDAAMLPVAATATPSIASIASDASHAAAPSSSVASCSHEVSAGAQQPMCGQTPPVHRLSAEQCKRAQRARRRAMVWLETGGRDQPLPPPSMAVAARLPQAEGASLVSSPSSLPSVADAVREALAVLQPLLPLGQLLALHGMGQGRRAPTRAASVPDAAYEEREQLRRLKETHDALLKYASKPRPLDPQAAATAAAATTEPMDAAPSSACSDTAAAAAAATALLAVATCAANTSQQQAHGTSTDANCSLNSAVDVRLQRLQVQQEQLDKFAEFHSVMYTQDSPELLVCVTAELELRPSRGVLGVFALRDLDAATFRCPYPGWLMSHALHNELHARFHVPTAIQLRNNSQQRRILVGDPGALGCVINGAQQTGDDVNMAFAWEETPRWTHTTAPISLCLRPMRDIAAGEELLLDYGDAFWQPVNRDGTLEHHCQVCFARDCSVFNEMFVCEGALPNGQPCSVGQHEHCFPNATAIPNRSSRSHWFCEAHTHKQCR